MRVFSIAVLLAVTTLPALAGEPFPTVPNRTSVGPFVSPSLDIRASNTAPQPTGPAGLWIGNRTLTGSTQISTGSTGSTGSTTSLFPSCFPGTSPCDFETSSFHYNGGD